MFHADRREDGQTDGRKDITNLIIAFRNCVDALKNRGGSGFRIFILHLRIQIIIVEFQPRFI